MLKSKMFNTKVLMLAGMSFVAACSSDEAPYELTIPDGKELVKPDEYSLATPAGATDTETRVFSTKQVVQDLTVPSADVTAAANTQVEGIDAKLDIDDILGIKKPAMPTAADAKDMATNAATNMANEAVNTVAETATQAVTNTVTETATQAVAAAPKTLTRGTVVRRYINGKQVDVNDPKFTNARVVSSGSARPTNIISGTSRTVSNVNNSGVVMSSGFSGIDYSDIARFETTPAQYRNNNVQVRQQASPQVRYTGQARPTNIVAPASRNTNQVEDSIALSSQPLVGYQPDRTKAIYARVDEGGNVAPKRPLPNTYFVGSDYVTHTVDHSAASQGQVRKIVSPETYPNYSDKSFGGNIAGEQAPSQNSGQTSQTGGPAVIGNEIMDVMFR